MSISMRSGTGGEGRMMAGGDAEGRLSYGFIRLRGGQPWSDGPQSAKANKVTTAKEDRVRGDRHSRVENPDRRATFRAPESGTRKSLSYDLCSGVRNGELRSDTQMPPSYRQR